MLEWDSGFFFLAWTNTNVLAIYKSNAVENYLKISVQFACSPNQSSKKAQDQYVQRNSSLNPRPLHFDSNNLITRTKPSLVNLDKNICYESADEF